MKKGKKRIFTRKFCLKAAGILLAALFLLIQPAGSAMAGEKQPAAGKGEAAQKEPDIFYEVRFLLDSDIVLNSDHMLTDRTMRMFNIDGDYKTNEVLYVETEDLAFLKQGWINRIRWKEGKKKAQLTYKKRYTVSGTEPSDISAALKKAAADGFDLTDERYSVEIDWGYEKMVLSVSQGESVKYKDYTGLEGFRRDDAVSLAGSRLPEEEANWKEAGWGQKTLENAKMAGPLQYIRYEWTWQDLEDVNIEIWPVLQKSGEVDYITELSFETDDYDTAVAQRQLFTAILEGNGILVHKDSGKTRAILDAYLSGEPNGGGEQGSVPARETNKGADEAPDEDADEDINVDPEGKALEDVKDPK